MATRVIFAFDNPTPEGVDEPARGSVRCALLQAEVAGGRMRSTREHRTDLNEAGEAQVWLSPTGELQAWYVVVEGVPGAGEWWVTVPESGTDVPFVDLPSIDPRTLDIRNRDAVAAWAAVEAKANEALELAQHGATPEQLGDAVEAYLAEHPPPGGVPVSSTPHPVFPGVSVLLVGETEPVFLVQPVGMAVGIGVPFALTAAVVGLPVPVLRWERSADSGVSWDPLDGATGPELEATEAELGEYEYRCVATSAAGVTVSDAALVAAEEATPVAPVMVADFGIDPVTGFYDAGGTWAGQPGPTWYVEAYGVPSPSVQWQILAGSHDIESGPWADIPGATSPEFVPVETPTSAARYYRAVFANTAGQVVSHAAMFVWGAAIVITVQPTDKATTAGVNVQFTSSSSGAADRQWERSTDGGVTWANAPGSSKLSNHTVSSPQLADSGNLYRLRLENFATGQVTYTNVVMLTVTA